MHTELHLAHHLLARWLDWSELHWRPAAHGGACWGTGYAHWGVQSHQKAVATVAMVGADEGTDSGLRERAVARALAGLRYTLGNHLTGAGRCADGTQWGHTWITALGLERMLFGIRRLDPHLTVEDRAALRRVLTSEADWLLSSYRRGKENGIRASKWNHEGANDPESNVWNGALLWRTAQYWPDAPHAADWEEQAHRFLLNGASTAAGASDDRIVAGKPVRARHVGPNFFDHYALDHHGYMNAGYMAITVSNAAILHFDLTEAGLPRPDSLDYGEAELWSVLRRMVFEDGRLMRIGGDSRVRYAYCQEFLLPALLYAADRLGDPNALAIADAQVRLCAREAEAAPADGRLFSERLAELERTNPLYYTRLESDRAVALGMYLAWRANVTPPAPAPATERFEVSVAGTWVEPEHGDALHRGPARFASFAWRAHGLTQALCLPPDASDLADWWQNLVSVVRFMGDSAADGAVSHAVSHRKLVRHWVAGLDGGFLTCGCVLEGMKLTAESLDISDLARHDIAIAALPDGRTLVGLERIRIGAVRAFVIELKGVHLNVPNDAFNGFRRTLRFDGGERSLLGLPMRNETIALGSRWANVDDRLGVALLYGADAFHLSRSAVRRGGRYHSLNVEELCAPCRCGPFTAEADETVLDLGWAALASASAAETAAFSTRAAQRPAPATAGDRREVAVEGMDGRGYVVAVDFGDDAQGAPMSLRIVS